MSFIDDVKKARRKSWAGIATKTVIDFINDNPYCTMEQKIDWFFEAQNMAKARGEPRVLWKRYQEAMKKQPP